MTLAVFDFTSIARKLNRQEQKADFEEKNPKPEPNKVVWHPLYGYGAAPNPVSLAIAPEWAERLAQCALDAYKVTSG